MVRKFFQIPQNIYDRDGPFEEFKQDVSIVSVELDTGDIVDGLMVLYPNYFARVRDHAALPFDTSSIVRAFQTADDLDVRNCAYWYELPHPWDDL